MSLKRKSFEEKVSALAQRKMPDVSNSVGERSGLRPRPQFEQIVDYLANGQERVNYPDREAKMIRNHPYMTQLDFSDMQIDQKYLGKSKRRKKR